MKQLSKKQTGILIIALVGLVIGVLGGAQVSRQQSGDDRQGSAVSDSGHEPTSAWVAQAAAWVRRAGVALQKVCQPHYDYPGCTYSQVKSLEAGTAGEFRRNYDNGRWGQGANGGRSRNQWDNLTPANNERFRQLYREAVQRFEAAQAAKGLTGKAAAARFQTWGDFKANLDCGGNFGVFSGLVGGWCRMQRPINQMADATTRLVLHCDGVVVGATVAGIAGAAFGVVTIPVGAMTGGTSGAVGCASQYIYDNLF